MHDIHWLRIPERITFRLAVLAYRCQNGLAPQYLADYMTFTSGGGQVTATAAFGGDCGTDHPRNGAFYVGRSRFLCRFRSDVEEPFALGYVISVPSGFPEASEACSSACLLLNGISAPLRLLVPGIVEIEHAILLVVSGTS